jgi:hypothetical protein
MQILGYSERGIINALFYDIQKSKDAETLLEMLLLLAEFPFVSDAAFRVVSAEILIEQSFSDFGDADVVLLINTGEHRISVFIEAKVKPSQISRWLIDDEFSQFVSGTQSKLHSSNLFTQLYYKLQMTTALRLGGLSALKDGVQFSQVSSKILRKIGNNAVVLRAAAKVQEYLDRTYYLSIVPDKPSNVNRFFNNAFKQAIFTDLVGWNIMHYGYLTWLDIEGFCTKHGLTNTLEVLRFNEGQIYS